MSMVIGSLNELDFPLGNITAIVDNTGAPKLDIAELKERGAALEGAAYISNLHLSWQVIECIVLIIHKVTYIEVARVHMQVAA